jgi:hypothetical protein
LQSVSNQVSAQSLRKTRIFADAAGDFRQLALQNQRIGILETKSNAQKPAIFGSFLRFLGIVTERRNAWLSWEDSNRYIPSLKMPFEISYEFRTNSGKSGAGDFRNYPSYNSGAQRPILCPLWRLEQTVAYQLRASAKGHKRSFTSFLSATCYSHPARPRLQIGPRSSSLPPSCWLARHGRDRYSAGSPA